jgi:cytoskeleton protein RodZ
MLNSDESPTQRELSPGEMLAQGRIAVGLTQEQIAKALYMTVGKVKALEADEYGHLISDTFVRGYLRAYSSLIKIDGNRVLEKYERLITDQKLKDNYAKSDVLVETPNRGAWQFLAYIAAFLIALWLISVWFFDNHNEPQYVAPVAHLGVSSQHEIVTTTNPVASSGLQNMTMPETTILPMVQPQVTTVGSLGSQSSSAAVSGATANASSGSAVNAALAPAAQTNAVVSLKPVADAHNTGVLAASSISSNVEKRTTLDEISFSFRGESWLEVSDSRGDVLATELRAAGSNIRLVGRAPFDVKLGNAPVVDIHLNGKKIDVIPLMGSNVLILKVSN